MDWLLRTKLTPPPPRPGLVSRPRLVALLAEGLRRPLTLVSAPAGFGKTTLIAEYRAAPPERTAPTPPRPAPPASGHPAPGTRLAPVPAGYPAAGWVGHPAPGTRRGEVRWNGKLVDPATFLVPPRAAYTAQVP
ncbi:MAG TPA: hypothetical protein VG370_23415, partial [Chloroflexota bacterium]|nr:hypothetical protein [Chloroflexota bacterium]